MRESVSEAGDLERGRLEKLREVYGILKFLGRDPGRANSLSHPPGKRITIRTVRIVFLVETVQCFLFFQTSGF